MNVLHGRLRGVEAADGIQLIDLDVEGVHCTATVVGDGGPEHWPADSRVTVVVRETEVALAKHLSGLVSLRNILPCVVDSVQPGKLLTRVGLRFGSSHLEAVITTRSADRLQLQPGDEVDALIKANEMLLLQGEVRA